MPTILELWGDRPLTELAERTRVPFRRLREYADGARPFSPADRAALAAFFGVAPHELAAPGAPPPLVPQRRGDRRGAPPVPLPPRAPGPRAPRPADAPPPTDIVTAEGAASLRATGVLQRAPAPEARLHGGGQPAFWLLELLVPHQPLRGQPRYQPIPVRCAVHRRLIDPFRWLGPGDKVVVSGTPIPRADHLYLAADELATPRADRLRQLLAALAAGDPAAEAGLLKLLGPHWRSAAEPPPGSGVQEARPPWAAEPSAVQGPQGRLQLSLRGQLQADPLVELDDAGDGSVELRLEIAPPRPDAHLPIVRYRVEMRLKALRGLHWLQRGDAVTIGGDIVRLGPELLVEATTLAPA
jgi:hypothetical protein